MVWERRSVTIINLCSDKDLEMKKCTAYWPQSRDQPWIVNISAKSFISITLTRELEETQFLTRRYFEVKQSDYENFHKVEMIHFKGWPDHSVPSEASFFDFYEIVKHLATHYLSKSPKPVVVHCSAGLGWTGTLILSALTIAELLMKHCMLAENEDIVKTRFCLARNLLWIWKDRFGLVQNIEQYKMVY